MRKYPAIIGWLLVAVAASAQTDSGTLLLHKFAKNIGKETYHITKTDSGNHYKIDFKFVDRGSPVPLQASIFVNRNGEAKQLWVKGNNCRFCTIHDSIVVHGQTAHLKIDDSAYTKNIMAPAFLVAGYAPGTVQMLLLQYWEKNGRPQVINMLPSGSIRIKKDGTDAVAVNNSKVTLQRYIISGLVWGNEIAWTDEQGRLICLITNDAEGDKLEMMAEPFEILLPQLIAKAAQYSMRLFTESLSNKNAVVDNFAIVGGNVLNVKDGTWIKNATLLIRNGKIVQMGPKDAVTIPTGINQVDAEGKTILPGLWDMHAHFQQAEWGPAYLGAGVTTVRDVGNEFEYINAIQQAISSGKGVGPHILKAGIIDGVGPFALGVINANTVEEAKQMVNMYKKNGFVQIKIYSSAKPAIVKAICDEAHRLGLTVTGHIPDEMNILQAIDSGMDAVNHVQYVYSILKKTSNGSIDWNDTANTRMIAQLARSRMVVDPTIGVYEMVFRPLDDDITLIEPAFRTLPLPLQSLFEHMGMPAERAKNFKVRYEAMRSLVKVLHDKGMTIVAGTDMGFPGYSLYRELELYVEAGLTPLEAIKTATITPARVMRLDAQYGSVEQGKVADLIIVDGDVLDNIRNIRKVEWVVKDGRLYDPLALRVMAGFSVRRK